MNAPAIGSIYGCRRLVATLIVSIVADAAVPRPAQKVTPQLELPLDVPEGVGDDVFDLYTFAREIPEVVRFWGLHVDGNRVRRGLIEHIDGKRLIRPEMLKLDQRDSEAAMRRNGRTIACRDASFPESTIESVRSTRRRCGLVAPDLPRN
jgi:hypothetical protein